MLITLGWIALIVGIILVVVGYTVQAQALRPGWGCIILAVVLILIGYLLPSLTTRSEYHGASPITGTAQPW